jgi:rRNA biogenesis protein RRP5
MEEDEDVQSEEGEDEINSSEDEEMAEPSEEESKTAVKSKSGKSALRSQITLEKEIRAKEAEMRSKDGAKPKSINDFERLLIADQDQSYLWIQYMAFMLEKLDVEAARRVAERAVKSVSITAETDKLNIWIAYMNLENKFGTEQ